MLSPENQVIITAVVCSLVFFTLGMLVGALSHHCATVPRACKSTKNSRLTPQAPVTTSTPVVYEEVSPDTNTERNVDIEFKDNVAYGPI